MSKKLTVAVDLDDTLAINAESYVKFSNKQWGTNLTVDDFQENFGAMWGVDHAEVERRVLEFIEHEVSASFPHIEEAIPVLKELGKKYRLIIVTSRRKLLAELTKAWVDKYFKGIFEEIHHAGIFDNMTAQSYSMTKAEICRDVGADYLIDDHPKHCLAVAEAGIKAVLFGDYSWNRDIKLVKGVARAKNWQEVKEYFDGEQN